LKNLCRMSLRPRIAERLPRLSLGFQVRLVAFVWRQGLCVLLKIIDVEIES
jgi:hypothetical protein